MLVRCLAHTPVRTPMFRLPLSQSNQRLRFVFQLVYNYTVVQEQKFSQLESITLAHERSSSVSWHVKVQKPRAKIKISNNFDVRGIK